MIHRQHLSQDDDHPPFRKQLVVRLTPYEADVLNEMAVEGGYPSLNCLIRSILGEVVRDELSARLRSPAA